MELTCTLLQAQAVRAIVGAQVVCAWVRDPNDATKVLVAALMDPKLGATILRFATAADQPTVAQLQGAFSNEVEVAGIA